VHTPLHAQMQIHDHVITSAQISFRAPYPVTNADQDYSVRTPICPRGLAGGGSQADVARGALVTIPVGEILSQACGRSVKFTVEYVSSAGGLPQPTTLGSITIHEAPGTHPAPLPRPVVELKRRFNPTRSLHAMIHLTLLPQPRSACNAAFLLYPCYKGQVRFTAPYAVTSATAGYSVDGFATCNAGGRPETSWELQRNARAHETLRSTSLGLFVLTPSCASREGLEVTYINRRGPSTGAPHESVIVGKATLARATLANGQKPKPAAG
jgi:hypothetical protein